MAQGMGKIDMSCDLLECKEMALLSSRPTCVANTSHAKDRDAMWPALSQYFVGTKNIVRVPR